ncbi:hypothetical protein PPL_09212 [Heterostelium album PN500]|uniref:Leishmanolysin-like peptidase n=1 Tax=Heterostelium pallidum (strain ATCC 26659 / Pp 5 / PN500) TaxID=670386 RepID=D3BKY0_HETP5|nr:hypothetical protein PPL_09212 [Heterostelium album PN500]EFA78560.1 hypothetical protein PPL_09212 [Heterostelium album PN500]|eukprot:XP_020430684.1 hypothetical protein PPL_09212 [Heterostelium album PN500]
MIKIISLVLSLFLILSVVSAAIDTKSLIDEYVSQLRNLEGGDQVRVPIDTKVKHECLHEELHGDHTPDIIEHFKKDGSSLYNNVNFLQQEGDAPTPGVTGTNNYTLSHPLNIFMNTTYLNGGDPQTCYSVGQSVVVGQGTPKGPCDRTNPSFPCTWTCESVDVVTPGLVALITQTILPNLNKTFATYLTANGDGNTTIPNQNKQLSCVGEMITLPPQPFTFQGDFMLYITAHPNTPRSIANGAMCVLFANEGPAIGFLNLNPMNFSSFVNQDQYNSTWNILMGVAIHETTHALGFTPSLYKQFIDRSTEKPYNYSIAVQQDYQGVTPSGQTYTRPRWYIVSPMVKAIARTHFNCDSLIGAELENIGANNYTSHWKATTFGEELMLGFALPVGPLSNLTLALLYDSGWFGLANLDKVEPLVWGKNKGCGFAEVCNSTTWNFPGYWNETQAKGSSSDSYCTATRSGVGNSYIQDYQTLLPKEYQHFADPELGSTQSFRDYCLVTDIIYSAPFGANYYCNDEQMSFYPNSQYETFGQGSRCLEYFNTTSNTYKPSCFQQRCDGKTLMVAVNNQWLACPDGQEVTFSAANNLIIKCPTDYFFCEGDAFPTEPSDQPTNPTNPPVTSGFPNITNNPTLTPTTSTTGVSSSSTLSYSLFLVLVLSAFALFL